MSLKEAADRSSKFAGSSPVAHPIALLEAATRIVFSAERDFVLGLLLHQRNVEFDFHLVLHFYGPTSDRDWRNSEVGLLQGR